MNIELVKDQDQMKRLEQYIQKMGKGMDHFISFCDLSYEVDPNQINECLIDSQGKIKNASFFKGTKDNGLIELSVIEEKESFLKQSVAYAFQVLGAKTITIFSEGSSDILESLGFESLGDYQGRTTYIKEAVMEERLERVK